MKRGKSHRLDRRRGARELKTSDTSSGEGSSLGKDIGRQRCCHCHDKDESYHRGAHIGGLKMRSSKKIGGQAMQKSLEAL